MYEKHGLMSKIRNPLVLAYLRDHNGKSYTSQIESALWKKLGKIPKEKECENRGRKKISDCRNCVPVKVIDPELVDYLISQRTVCGISHRHTIENAILEVIAGEAK